MRLSASSAASCGLIWMAMLVSILGAVCVNSETEGFREYQSLRLVKRQLPDLSNISPCGLNCLVQSISGVGCELTNVTCSCASTDLGQRAGACLIANCTMQDSLDLAKLQATQCTLPHESQTTKMLVILITVYVIALIAIALRLVAKSQAKTWNIDDILIVAAIGFGMHLYDLEPGALLEILRLLYAAEIVYVFVLLIAKLSLVVFYLRIFTVPKFRIAAYSLIGFLVVGQVVIGFLTIFSCHPIELFWDKNIHTGGCLDINQLAYANSALAIIQDLIILALPIAMLPGLQMNRNKKISVAIIFMLGSVGFISTIIRLQVLAVFGNSIDPTWDYTPVVWWTTIELGVVIVCACLPMIRTLVEKMFPGLTLFRWTSPKPSNDSYGSGSGSEDKSQKTSGRFKRFGRSQSPLQFSDNYVRDHLTSPPTNISKPYPTNNIREKTPDVKTMRVSLAGVLETLGLIVPVTSEVTHGHGHPRHGKPALGSRDTFTPQVPMPVPPLTIGDGIDFATRAHWMRQANLALPNPCPFGAFGAVVVNHTGGGLGELVCAGANDGLGSGNPTLHGEMVAINHCSGLFTDAQGPYRMTPAEALAAFADLTLYTNAESCPMCASAIRWAGFREYVYGTSIETLVEKGWGQIRISSRDVFEQSAGLPRQTGLTGPVLANETDVFFGWQFVADAPCPRGCYRERDDSDCQPV
ncbi:Guanine deaminase [Colletotrichum chlorophyti]|uniref:Guanine deaminase n=1 Tax=Colletotrichum chlorophyti TaxID=708187 RepID=A0A1Q8RRH6_9PEZI|nr:Guanine deaminase [Colletotrichum chlorophyti]